MRQGRQRKLPRKRAVSFLMFINAGSGMVARLLCKPVVMCMQQNHISAACYLPVDSKVTGTAKQMPLVLLSRTVLICLGTLPCLF